MLSSLLTPTGILSDDDHPPTQPPVRETRSVKTAILLWLVLAHILVHPPELAVQRSLPSPSLPTSPGLPKAFRAAGQDKKVGQVGSASREDRSSSPAPAR